MTRTYAWALQRSHRSMAVSGWLGAIAPVMSPPPCHRRDPGGCIPFGHHLVIDSLIPNTRAGPYVPIPRPPTPRANGYLYRHARLLRCVILRIVPGNEVYPA